MEREERNPKGLHTLFPLLFGKCREGRTLLESVALDFFKLVSCFPPGPHLFCYLPHHLLLLLFIVYLPNEGGGVDW